MLKIKDNVDLKELEKFGLKLDDDFEYSCRTENDGIVTFVVVENDRAIYVQSNVYIIKNLDILYDLIKADIVEKVD